jgi:hypothetical protein
MSLLFVSLTHAQLREVKNEAFQRGELLTYKAYYDAILTGEVIAGSCTFQILDENKLINDRSTYHMQVIGKTKGAFNLFFKVIDRYESYIDEKALLPWLFIRRVNEGGYIINQDVTFNQNKKVAYFKDLKNGRTANVTVPANVQDLVSAIYYCRSIDLSTYNINQDFSVKFLLDDTVFSTKVLFLGKETVSTSIGKIRCIKIKPQVLTGSVFKDPYPVILWVSDDKNKIPVKAESEILVGKVKLELINYSGLKNPFTAMVK